MNILTELLYHAIMFLVIGFATFQYTKDFIKSKYTLKIRQIVLMVVIASFLNYFFLLTRSLHSILSADFPIHYFYSIEMIFDLFTFVLVFRLFYYIRKKVDDCSERNVMFMILELLVGLVAFSAVYLSIMSNGYDTAIESMVMNLRTFYLVPYSLLVFLIFLVIPKSIHTFSELKKTFLVLSIAFLLEFVVKYTQFIDQCLSDKIYEIVLSIKLFCFISIIYHFYRITLLEPEKIYHIEEISPGCKD